MLCDKPSGTVSSTTRNLARVCVCVCVCACMPVSHVNRFFTPGHGMDLVSEPLPRPRHEPTRIETEHHCTSHSSVGNVAIMLCRYAIMCLVLPGCGRGWPHGVTRGRRSQFPPEFLHSGFETMVVGPAGNRWFLVRGMPTPSGIIVGAATTHKFDDLLPAPMPCINTATNTVNLVAASG